MLFIQFIIQIFKGLNKFHNIISFKVITKFHNQYTDIKCTDNR